MKNLTKIALVVCVLAASPAFAGNLSLNGAQTVWRPTGCTKPVPPASVVSAHPETSGEDMNALIGKHNEYVSEAQAYMNCIGSEAERDQSVVVQTIASTARKEIADMQADVDAAASALQSQRK